MEHRSEDLEMPILGSDHDSLNTGHMGEELKRGRKEDVLRLAMISVYGILMIGFGIWTFSGEKLSSSDRVLPTGRIEVDQFYSGLALSAIFTPLAILLRNTAERLSKIHPFMVAKRTGISVADLDRMSEGGIGGAMTIVPYSLRKGVVQICFLIAGAVIVPCATLIITTGIYTVVAPSTGVIGLPVGPGAGSGQMLLDITMDGYNVKQVTFQQEVSDLYCGQLLASAGLLPTYDTNVLSNTPTTNLSLTNGTWYSGILTYSWDAGCEPAPEIAYNYSVGSDAWFINFWSPNGTMSLTYDIWDPTYVVWLDDVVYSNRGAILVNDSDSLTITSPGATSYYAIAGVSNTLIGNNQSGDGLVVGPEIWVATVKCQAQMRYQVSRCQWNGMTMSKCTELPGGNTTQLDTIALAQLSDYLNAMPVALAIQGNYLLGNDIIVTSLAYSIDANTEDQYRAPRVTDFTNMYGLVAYSMVLDMTNGYYGTATIPVEDQSEKLVYAVRLPWFLGVSVMVLTCVILLLYDLISSHVKQSPIREMSFIAIAAATRGYWWMISSMVFVLLLRRTCAGERGRKSLLAWIVRMANISGWRHIRRRLCGTIVTGV